LEVEFWAKSQLHQWNFDVNAGRLLLFNRRHHFDVGAHFAALATTTASLIGDESDAKWLGATLIRASPPSMRSRASR
jgi:hypothetical protein